ncbi:hypothetical protein ACOMHN_048864 [Nucella lapillus]
MMRGFDSIESMNTEELLVRRRKRSKKYLFALALACAVFFTLGFLIGFFAEPRNGGEAKPSTSGGDSFDYAKFIVDNIDRDRIRENLRRYSSQPRLAGTELGEELSGMIKDDWTANGIEEVHLATYHVLLSYPNTSHPNVIQIVNTTDDRVLFESHKFEIPLTPHENNSHVVPPFNGYSPAGDVTGDIVYVNYGRIEDFLFLASNLSVNVTGKIVIARYGNIYRGDKLSNAERFKALAMILYSDPRDCIYQNEENNTYPHSWWLPPSGIQRGTTLLHDGDPQTPLYPSTDYAYRLTEQEAEVYLPHLPSQPIGYNDAQNILSLMGGPSAPASWQGGLNFTYRIGPGFLSPSDMKIRVMVNNYREVKPVHNVIGYIRGSEEPVMVNNYREVKPVHNVIGYIRGSEEPDRYVLLGNHFDAWVFGAVDPHSGTAAVTEITRVFGQMLQQGHRPRRTVVFCAWDAEEYGLLGSMEWVEDHTKVLQQRGVAYLNMDSAAVANFTMAVGTSPLLQNVVYQAAKQVPSPDPSVGQSLYDLWKARPRQPSLPASPDPYLTYSLGSGSDMATFYQRAGVSCVDMSMTYDKVSLPVSTYPLYHSSYETFFAYDTFIDPGFTATASITHDLANADLLPMSVERYSAAVSSFHQSLMDSFQDVWRSHNVNMDAFSSAVSNFTAATKAFQERLDSNKDSIINSPLKLRGVNDQLIHLERAFLDPQGLPGRPEQKHVMFAPSQFDGYRDNSFPGIVDTMFEIQQGHDRWEQLKKQVYVTTYTVQSAASTLEDVGL